MTRAAAPAPGGDGGRTVERNVAEHAAIAGLTLRVAFAVDEAEVISALLEVAESVCGAAATGFRSADPEILPSTARPPTAEADLAVEALAPALTPAEDSVISGDGFVVRLVGAGDPVGSLVVRGVDRPEDRADFVALMIPAAAVAAMAIVGIRSRRWPGSAEGHFRGMADRSSDVIWSIRDLPQPHVTYLSPAFGTLTGLTAAHLDAHPALLAGLFGWPGPARPAIGSTTASDVPVTCADGRVILLEVARTVVADGVEGTARDVTAERAARVQLTERADTDPLTGLPHRATFVRRLDELLAAGAGSKETVTVAFLDLDDFKAVNDKYGHAAGDAVLIEMARRLEVAVRAGDIVARMGGDEFVVAQARGAAGQGVLVRRLTTALSRPIDVGDAADVPLTCIPCIGTADTSGGERDAESLIRAADKAMYRLKAVRAMADHARSQLVKGRHEFPGVMAALAYGIVLRDPDGNFVDCNPAAEQLLGQSRDQMAETAPTDPGWSLIHPDGSDFAEDEMPHRIALATSEVVSDVVMGVLGASVPMRWLLVSSAPLADPGGGPVHGVVSTLTDITVERQAREAESALARRLGAAVDSLPEAVFVHDAVRDGTGAVVDLLFSHVNEAGAQLSGLSVDDLVGHGLLEVFPFLRDVGVFDTYVDILASGEPQVLELPWSEELNPGGVITLSVSRAGDGLVAIARGSAERAAERGALQIGELQFMHTFADAPIPTALIAIDPCLPHAGRIVLANDSLATFLGCSAADLLAAPAPGAGEDVSAVGLLVRIASDLLADAGSRTVERRIWVPSAVPHWGVVSLTTVGGATQDPTLHLLQIQDTSDKHRAEEQLAHSSLHDSLTDMPNRIMFVDHLQQELAASRSNSHKVGLVLLDLDDFKSVNASLGHDAGDQYLIGVATTIRGLLGEHDRAARLGGDEFVVLCGRTHDISDVSSMAELIRGRLADGVTVGGQTVTAAASLGVAVSRRTSTPQTMLAEAASAMYVAKRLGGNRWAPAPPPVRRKNAARVLTIERDLRMAVEADQLSLRYQPVYDLATGRLVEVEALVRWEHPVHGLVSPSEFIPIAERRYLISAVGDCVLEKAVAQAAQWRDEIGADAPVIAINVSTGQLGGHGFPRKVMAELAKHGLSPDRISVEVTETQMISVTDRVRADLVQLQLSGIAIAVDDFGTGHAGFDYLRTLPVNILKVDKSFVDGLGSNVTDTAIAVSIIALGLSLGLTLIAEGVETQTQLSELRRLGCQRVQGWLWRPALPARGIVELIGLDEATVRTPDLDPTEPPPCPVLAELVGLVGLDEPVGPEVDAPGR
ncbi:MAG TPA: diguanylate cyclase [Motilibacterales bacterium]|nr:diguanylate cyclase [Motilibacterales bacterium]